MSGLGSPAAGFILLPPSRRQPDIIASFGDYKTLVSNSIPRFGSIRQGGHGRGLWVSDISDGGGGGDEVVVVVMVVMVVVRAAVKKEQAGAAEEAAEA